MEQAIIDNYGYTEYLNWCDAMEALDTIDTDNLELLMNI